MNKTAPSVAQELLPIGQQVNDHWAAVHQPPIPIPDTPTDSCVTLNKPSCPCYSSQPCYSSKPPASQPDLLQPPLHASPALPSPALGGGGGGGKKGKKK